MDSGVGGALIDGGRVMRGAHGMGGEFGHLPFGSRAPRCRCGARGCWNTELDGAALARLLDRPLPADEVTFSRAVIAAARDGVAGRAPRRARGRPGARARNRRAGQRLRPRAGRALRPGRRTARRRARAAAATATGTASCRPRAADPPPSLAGALGDRAPLVGAMEFAFAPVLADPRL